ncbi:hypothetical protein DMENIID0001_130360 [Sergentomyia squamirostris]
MIVRKVFGVVITVSFLVQAFANGSGDSWIGKNSQFEDMSSSAAENFARNLYPERLVKDPSEEKIQSRAENSQTLISSNLLGGIMRMMGFDSGKLGALVINGLIFLAQMVKNATMYLTTVAKDWKIGKSLAARMFPASPTYSENHTVPPFNNNFHPAEDSQAAESMMDRRHEYRSTDEPKISEATNETPRSGSPLDWILTNASPHLNRLMVDARDRNLPQRLVELVSSGKSNWSEGECILRLLCKTSPFVWAMQQAIADRIDGVEESEDNHTEDKGSIVDTIMRHIPNAKEVDMHGDACEERYPNCKVYT